MRRTQRLFALTLATVATLLLTSCDGAEIGSADTNSGSRRASHSGQDKYDVASIHRPSAADIRSAQRMLSMLGYDPGPVDGVFGKKTRIAIKHFQVDEELAVDGRLTASLLRHLERTSRQAGSEAQSQAQSRRENRLSVATSHAAAGPIYEAGDTYVYSDGKVETVSRVGPEQILWETTDGSSYTAFRNFILPPISWTSGTSSGENTIEPKLGNTWPPAEDTAISFSVGSRAAGSVVYATPIWSGKWHCATGGVTTVKATVGTFEAISLVCDRSKPAPGTWKKRTWYFVPAIGHYIRRTDIIHGTGRRVTVDLVAVRPGGKTWPPAARGGLDWAIQGALDVGDINEAIKWHSSAVGAAFQIRVDGMVPGPKGILCRRYIVERTSTEQARQFPAVACKRPDHERWLIPGLEPDAIPPQGLRLP